MDGHRRLEIWQRARELVSAVYAPTRLLGSLAEIDSMLVVLSDLYGIDDQEQRRIDALRIDITRGIFGLLRCRAR